MKLTTTFKCFVGLWFAGVIVIFARLIIPALAPYALYFTIFGWVLVAAGFIIGLIFFKCPYCSKRLPLQSGVPSKCPHCGKKY